MNDTKIVGKRGRPRAFDRDEALAKAQTLFHARGYDALSVADLTEAIGINPPSFYAAFGSKVQLYDEALGRYVENDGLDLVSILAPGTPLAVGVANLLRYAAEAYTSGGPCGCMVIEGARGIADSEANSRARARLDESRASIHKRIALLDPANADLATDYAMTSMAGLSASARNGMPAARLQLMASIAADGFSARLERGI
ncbi:transcriptional regulator, TetR family [Rhizobium sp. NFR07]|uniref:TetR/AcrR family transcriptional regulator n=1 Tax=Rhizobium sp. NFR07 TaxID=1566262 RepID=UPI0008E010B7|nr:TetR/AcrR family transcriptional regulator [Rhizobium sp. NFR07]SFB50603.1 transcriptional regulator, TetR family [Rhizobium sp. NFR07]